jgi:cellulose synthase/poly-beta-1,6-N-acetylglucosamine synthase-like glycosyltransferase
VSDSVPGISFIVPVYNAMPFLPESIGALRKAVARAGCAEVFVLDNGSTDGSWEWLQRELKTEAHLRQLPGVTISVLRNAGARMAKFETFAFIDADCVIPENYAARALAALTRSSAAAVGSRYALPPAPHWIERTWQELHERRHDGPVTYINSGNFVVRAAPFERVGGFDESLVTGEDAELGQRLTRAGHLVYESRDVMAVHLGNPKSIGHFFRKQKWHALGMFGTVNLDTLDRPTAMTFLQLGFLLLAGGVLLGSTLHPWTRLGAASGIALLPATLTVAYRLARGGQTRNPVAAVTLYFLYYLARLAALVELGVSRISGRTYVPH